MKEAKIKGTVSLNTARMGQMKRSLLSIALASMGLGLGVAGHAQNLNLQSTARVQNSQEDKFALNFVNADIDAVVRAIGSFTNQTFVVDPRVRGTISLVSPQPLSAADAKNALLAALRLQGFTIVESGGIARVLPENDAKVQADSVDPRKAMNQSGNAIVTQVFQLNYESATALVPVLRPLIAPNNTIAAYPNNNTLVITDYADNLQRIARIIASIDGPYSGDLEVVPLEHALAVDLAAILGRMLDEGNRGTGAAVDAGQRLSVMADPRTNSLLLRTPSKARLNLAKALIAKLDQPTKQPGNVWVVYLKNAEAAKLAKTLQAVLSSSPISDNNSSSGLSSLSGGGIAGGGGGLGCGDHGECGGAGPEALHEPAECHGPAEPGEGCGRCRCGRHSCCSRWSRSAVAAAGPHRRARGRSGRRTPRRRTPAACAGTCSRRCHWRTGSQTA